MKGKNLFKSFLYTISILLTIVYIIYRIFFTIPTKLGFISILFSILVLLIEIWETFDFFIYFFNILIVNKKQLTCSNLETTTQIPEIDILIATLNETPNILERTINACLNLDYPDKSKLHIYLCDDGDRREIELLAKNKNINYIHRYNNKDAKAGNYNHALKQISSPYVATFDADMAPTKDFLTLTLPFFINNPHKKIGFVQLPQSFINPDIFQYRFRLENEIPFEQEYFYHSIQIAKNETNSTIYCGTNALFSRSALDAIHGFATGTLTEDIATGMLLEANGYQGIALNKIGAYGIFVNDFDGFMKQRSRWARGCIQMAKKYKIMSQEGLSMKQKLEYLSCVSYWFFPIRRFVYLIAPLFFSIWGIIIVDCNLLTFLSIWLPTYLLKRFALDLLQNKERSSTWNKIYEIIQTPILFFKVIGEFLGFSKMTFEVSPKKSSPNDMTTKNKWLLSIHSMLLLLNLVGFIMCMAQIYDASISNYILSFVWTLSNTFYLFFAILFDIRYKKPKKQIKFEPNKTKHYHVLKTLILAVFHK